jgi:signal transduction histidine kinase/CheY-like chemotaxis protein
VDASIERGLNDELLRNSARLSFSSAAIYPFLFVVIYLSTSIEFSHLALCGFLAVLPAGIARIIAARRVLAAEHPSEANFQLLLRLSVTASVLGWCLFSGTTIQLEGAHNWNSMFLLLISTGIASGGASSLASDLRLSYFFIFCLWVTHASVFFANQDWSTATLVTLYSLYLAVQSKRQNQRIVGSIVDSERLKLRTVDLQEANREARQAQETTERALVMAQEAQREAEAASQAKSTFLATISHEIRTPLHGVLGMNTLLLDSELPEEQREYAESIQSSGEALLSLINEVLDFSKLEAGGEVERLEDFQLSELLGQTEGIVSSLAREKSLSFALSLDETIPRTVRGDAAHLRQVVLNLLTNAIKFTDAGGVRLDAKLLKEVADRIWVEIRVSDTGIGISPEHQSILFEPFRQVNSSTTRTRGGTGLGLAISKRLSDLMGGTLVAESVPDEGSTFTLHVPLTHPATDVVRESEPELLRLHSAGNSSQRILVVEDNPTNQKILQRLLLRAGYDCEVVDNGREAIKAAVGRSFDLILMDCHMPEMDGYDATRCIVERMGERAPPIVAVTANASMEDRRRCRESGMVDFLGKPVRLNLLQKVLDTHLAESGHADAE